MFFSYIFLRIHFKKGTEFMNKLTSSLLRYANQEALYNLYLYIAHLTPFYEFQSLFEIINNLRKSAYENRFGFWKERDLYRLKILENALSSKLLSYEITISDLTYSKNGLTACVVNKPDDSISVCFKGTGKGEWIDNGEGLSGIPEENTYYTYDKNGKIANIYYIQNDYATDQQTEALNWFKKIAAKYSWNTLNNITLSGHSKGGNKAQFITISDGLIKNCFSFDAHGFSPEAILYFKTKYKDEFDKRKVKIRSFSADNDYVNVLGKQIVPKNQAYYFKSFYGIHPLEAILDKNGYLHTQTNQGILSAYARTVSDELMKLKTDKRQYATLGIMNIFQKFVGKGTPVNNDSVSLEKTVAGIGIAVNTFIKSIR